MSYYPQLKPIFASSTMHVFRFSERLKFSNVITYDYVDMKENPEWQSYYDFLKISKNFDRELELYWENMQEFLDAEENLINGKAANQNISHCNIYFRDKTHPFVQWFVEFQGDFNQKENFYENLVESEVLKYPIYSVYIFHAHLIVSDIESSLQYNLNPTQTIIEYYGEIGELLEGYESISFKEKK